MMSVSVKNSISDQEIANNGTRNAANCCSSASSELKLYQAFIFSVPILFTFILLFLFYWFYLRRRRADWSSLRMRSNNSTPVPESIDDLSRCEMGVKKELREMLPIIVFNESFSVKDTQCSVCLGDYQTEDRLQQIPGCRHTFHIDCIDLWLTTHTTCPLCRKSLLASNKVVQVQDNTTTSDVEGVVEEASLQNSEDDPQTSRQSLLASSKVVQVPDNTTTSDAESVVEEASLQNTEGDPQTGRQSLLASNKVVQVPDNTMTTDAESVVEEASRENSEDDPQTSRQPTECGSTAEAAVGEMRA